VEFTYRLVGLGWAEARLVDGAASATITASYLSDALADLLEAVVGLLAGADETRCCWAEEPGQYRWIFQRYGRRVDLDVLWFDDDYNPEIDFRGADEHGKLVFSTQQSLSVLAAAIADGAGLVLAEYGEEGYLEQWHLYPFPTEALVQVQTLLSDGWPEADRHVSGIRQLV
jgi:hypothetical protein